MTGIIFQPIHFICEIIPLSGIYACGSGLEGGRKVMHWWNSVIASINREDVLQTPGTVNGARRKTFRILFKDTSLIRIDSGTPIPLEKPCFDVIEAAFNQNATLWLRIASVQDNEPLPNSADKLIREATGSNLARGNYVCAILEHCGLVKYSRQGNWKVIVLP